MIQLSYLFSLAVHFFLNQNFVNSVLGKPLSKTILCFSIFSIGNFFGQVKFNPDLLNDYKNNGPEIAKLLNTIEVPEYTDTFKNCIYLKNGFRSSKFINEADWLAIKENVIPFRIDVVYSKYPMRDSIYYEIYSLLANRLISLFETDPYLNDKEIEWNKVLQTNCKNSSQVNSLFHGIVIWYQTVESINVAEEKLELEKALNREQEIKAELERKGDVESVQIAKVNNNDLKEDEQKSFKEVAQSIENIKSFSLIPDSVKQLLEIQTLDKQILTMKRFLRDDIATEPDKKLKNASEKELIVYKREIEAFLEKFPARDSVVKEVFDRHPEWKNMLVINDWTASMYGDGAQVLLWHLLNFEKSGIKSITLFNDGDDKSTEEKGIGKTGGIYTEKPDNIEKLNKLFNYIMLQGTGGDYPENDIEAILKAMNENPYFSEIVLIADNSACVRDIQLTELIGKPVKIIVCGYDRSKGLNPDLVYIAKKTRGGIYTINSDIENIDIEYDSLGKQTSLIDSRFRLSTLQCYESRVLEKKYRYQYEDGYKYIERYDIILENEENTDLKEAKKHKKKIDKLIIQSAKIVDIDKSIYGMKKLVYLNLSNNDIKSLSPKINKLKNLKSINLSYNKLKKIPNEIKEVLYIESLNLSNNKLTYIPNSILGMNFLRILDLSNNQITYFDKKIQLRKLEKLNLSNNKLKELTKDIGQLKNLKILNLSNNLLESLPNGITSLSNLTELNLKNNKLTKLPTLLFKLRKLKVLNLENNNFSEEEKNRIKSILIDTLILF